MINEEEFYKQKIFFGIGINELKKQHPESKLLIEKWYKSAKYNVIQDYKLFLSNKLKQFAEEDEEVINATPEELLSLYKWWDGHEKKCFYCGLLESELETIRNLPGHINKRYPQRGQSLEIDRKKPHLPYTDTTNIVLACYWCNNAKTDTFTDEEFDKIGKEIKRIWDKRLGRIM